MITAQKRFDMISNRQYVKFWNNLKTVRKLPLLNMKNVQVLPNITTQDFKNRF